MTANAKRPRVAVFKFASCDGCQLTLLDAEDELLRVAGAVDFVHFLEASSRVESGPYDLALVEGSITTAEDAERIRAVRRDARFLVTIGACATAGGIQALRNWADHAEFLRAVYAQPDYISTLATSTAIADHVPVDFELRGCPIDRRTVIGGDHGVSCRQAAASSGGMRLPRLQTPRHGVRYGSSGSALFRAGDAGWLRCHLPVVRSWLLWLFRTCTTAESGEPDRTFHRRWIAGRRHDSIAAEFQWLRA